jgi:hypothetical protein
MHGPVIVKPGSRRTVAALYAKMSILQVRPLSAPPALAAPAFPPFQARLRCPAVSRRRTELRSAPAVGLAARFAAGPHVGGHSCAAAVGRGSTMVERGSRFLKSGVLMSKLPYITNNYWLFYVTGPYEALGE